MRPTMILFAHQTKFAILAERPKRFAGTRSGLIERLYAAWLVFSGRADALMWNGEEPYGDSANT